MLLTTYMALMHPDSHEHSTSCDCQAMAIELGIKWPECPWTCRSCSRTFTSHAMTLAIVQEKLIKTARSIVGKARKRLEHPERLDPTELAQTKLLQALAEEVLAHPASFVCSPCVLKHHVGGANTSTTIDFITELLGSSAAKPS